MLCNQTLDVLPPRSIVPILVSLPKKKKKSTENSTSENAIKRSNSSLPTEDRGFDGLWDMGGGDPRAASSVWPCIAPNGSTNYQFPQAPIAKT